MMIQPPDDDERTNSMGLFNTAEAFRLSAMALEDEKVKIGHTASPIRICYYHALELYLKALLRQKHSVKKIKEKFGHNTKLSTPQQKCIGWPEQKYISDAGKKAPELGAFSSWPTGRPQGHVAGRHEG
jgi:hypothetical protein